MQIRRALRPDGFFLASMFGGDTLGILLSFLIIFKDSLLIMSMFAGDTRGLKLAGSFLNNYLY
jgi:hypothetical protein